MIYYRVVNNIQLDILSIKRSIASYVYERAKLIKLQAPNQTLKSMDFSDSYFSTIGGSHPSDNKSVARIEMLTMMISEYEKILMEKEFALRELKDQGVDLVKRLKRANKSYTTLQIFIATHIDGKSNEEVMQMGYAPSTIYNAHTEVNKFLQLEVN